MAAEEYLARHFEYSAGPGGGPGDAPWLRGTENPADTQTKVRSDKVRPILSGAFTSTQRRGLEGVSNSLRIFGIGRPCVGHAKT